jgi:hypothetical protein
MLYLRDSTPTKLILHDVIQPKTQTTIMTETKPDVEAQTAPAAAASPAASPVSSGEYEEDAGKGLGIANFVLLLVAFILGWFFGVGGLIAFACEIAAIIITSTISCGCCCASNLKLNPKVKRWNDAVLVTICIMIVISIIAIIIFYSAGQVMTTGYVALYWINRILVILSIVFAGIFAFGRKCCGNA